MSPVLAQWGPTLTCYTAALAVYLSSEDEHWWRVLVEGGPHLGLSPAPDGLHTFRHHPRSPFQRVGLRARGADTWAGARSGIQHQLDAHGRVIIAADGFHALWLTSYARRHGPHWFVLARAGDGYIVDDPLEHVDECGRQQPIRVRLSEAELAGCCGALTNPAPPHVLREEAALGTVSTGLGHQYRWLERGEPVNARPEPATPATPDAAYRLADGFDRSAADPAAYAQVDDVWQALRQRELLLKVLDVESGLQQLQELPAPDPWRQVTELWRRLPPLLLHARLLAGQGVRGRSADVLVETLRAIAESEGRLADQRFPLVVG